MKCLRCQEEKELFVSEAVNDKIMGFCIECWVQVNRAGYCTHCKKGEDLYINAMWHGRIIEHICGYCKATAI